MKNKKLIFSFIILFFVAFTQALAFLLPSSTTTIFYGVIRPALYFLLLMVTMIFIGINFGYSAAKKRTLTILLFGTLLYIALLLVSGFIAGFGRNPMSNGLAVFARNVWEYVPFIVIGEILRFQLIKSTDKKHKRLITALITVVFSFAMLETLASGVTGGFARQLEFLMVSALPVLVLNFFLTYVCQSGALAGTTVFRAAYSMIPILVPVLPNISKIFLAILLYISILVMFLLYNKYIITERQPKRIRTKHRWGAYAVTSALLIVCIIFGAGLLPAAPVAVASDSMKGAFNRGDMLIVRKLSAADAVNTLEVGDVIQFKSGNISIVHRIIEIKTDYKGEIQYVTKGDNNTVKDSSPVSPDQIIGVAKFKIPYLGYPPVFLMELFSK